MPTLRWTGDGTITDNRRNLSARPGEEVDVSDEQAEDYLNHDLFGDDWEEVEGESDSSSEDTSSTDETADSTDSGSEDLASLSGVGESKAETLREAGFETFADLRAASEDDLADIDGISDSLAADIAEQVATDGE